MWFAMAARAGEQELGALGVLRVSSAGSPGQCQAIREPCLACFDIFSCQTIN